MKEHFATQHSKALIAGLVFLIACGYISAIREPHLVFSHALGLESLNFTSLLTQEFYTNGHNIFDLDVLWDETSPRLFWSDLQEGRIYSGVMKNEALEQVNMVVSHGIVSVEGIAVDWIAHNLYLVESRYGWIEVADLKHKWRTVIVTNIDAPRALALDSRDGLLFWTDRSENRPKIERSTMSGRSRREIVDINSLSNGGLPNGLTIDYLNRRLYWIDAKSDSIYSANYDGHDLQQHYYDSQIIQSPFGLSFHNENLYWVDAKLNTINKINIQNGSLPEVVYKTYHSLYGVVAVHQDHHPKSGRNPCLLMGCSHICLLDENESAVCRCPQLMTLSPDGKKCQEVEQMILVSEFHKEGNDGFSVILGLSDNNVVRPLTFPIVPPSHTEIVGLDLDDDSGYIYWADATTNSIWKASILGTEISKALYLGYGKVTGFGANWENSTIYYSSVGNDKGIFSCSIKSSNCVPILDGFHEPHLLALHPIYQKLFWIEKKMDRIFILSSNLDGSNCTTVYDTISDRQPDLFKSFTLDPKASDLYWIDSESNEILRYNMSGIRTISKFNSSYEINTLIIDNERILVSDSRGRIHALDKSSGNYIDIIYNSTGAIRSLRPVRTLRVTSHVLNPCAFDNGGCSEQCVHEINGNVSCLPWPTVIPGSVNASSPFNIISTTEKACHLKCKNGGQCQIDAAGNFECRCQRGRYGHVCQYSVCENYCVNGQCFLNEENQPLCICSDGYYGKNCENSVCDKFCQHGRCQNVYENQLCVCSPGWTGSMCHILKYDGKRNASQECAFLCLNEGECEMDESENTFTCSCRSGFSGDRCEIVTAVTASCLALILVSAGWVATLLSMLLVWYQKSSGLCGMILGRSRTSYKTTHKLLVDYNANGPSEHGAVYNVLSSPLPTRHLHFFNSKRVEVDDLKLLTETEELNETRNWENAATTNL